MRHLRPLHLLTLLAPLSLALPACGDDGSAHDASSETGTPDDLEVPESYVFDSRFDAASSVSYSGQVMRQVLISSLKTEMSTIQSEIENEAAVFEAGEVRARLSFYYEFDSETAGSLPHGVATDPPPLQATYGDISSDKDLKGKIAGQDTVGQHRDWSTGIVGWDGNPSPDALINQWFDELDAMAVAYSSGTIPTSPDGAAITVWYVDAQGRDYQQLLQKFLLGAVNYSQASDDYLDDADDGKGLLTDNVAAVEGENYTELEHQWDEGFGYFGAAVDYLAYSDATLAATAYQDHDGDGAIDLTREYNFGASINASKRDDGAVAATDFSTETMTAFLTGRAIIAHAEGPLDETAMDALKTQRDRALLGWERAMASTAVHYINDTLADLNAVDTSFEDLAKHWSELKGFVLALQFNPRKQISDADYATLNTLIGTAPGDDAAYQADLVMARDLLGEAYAFDAANLGDAQGQGGW